MTDDNMDVQQMILHSAEKIFTDHCDKALLDSAEAGEFPQALWQLVVENGFDQLGTAASGTSAADMYAFIQVCGEFAVPLPLADTLLVNFWCDGADNTATDDLFADDSFADDSLADNSLAGNAGNGIASIGELSAGLITRVPWGRRAERVVGIRRSSREVLVARPLAVKNRGVNLAGEARDDLQPGATTTVAVDRDPYAHAALSRICLMAGGLQAVLNLGLQFAGERQQFGRTISKFQAIQHSLAVVAAEVAAAKRAACAAVDALADGRFELEVAASKARVGEAVGIVAEQVHQIHGAMGFTHEHRLHHYSRRIWAWRDEWGNEFYWQTVLGAHLARLGADQAWPFIATRV